MAQMTKMMSKPRGIINASHVSCHLTCALQLLIHGIEPLREALVETSRSKQGNAFLLQLGDFLDQYQADSNDDEPIDPSHLYKVMQEKTAMDPHSLGDAVTALRRILQAIRTSAAPASFTELYNELLGGTVRQDIIGTSGSLKRIKSKDRQMQCPLPIPGGYSSVEEGLAHATIEHQTIKGYDWEQATNYVESELDDCTEDTDAWITHKTTRFVSLPQHLLLHLQRFTHEPDGTVTPINSSMDVPLTIDMKAYQCDDSLVNDYQLHGAILHVLDYEDEDNEEGGHYVSVLRDAGDDWYLVDDHKVTSLADDEVLSFLSGRPSSVEASESTYIAVLLLYRRQGSADFSLLLESLRTELAQLQLQQSDANGIGKRLKVQWSKGKWYAGVITEYNERTGKHTVLYDDGEVKEYNLAKKTVEWE